MRPLALTFLLAFLLAAPVAAQVPSTMTFQGVLTDGVGTPYPDGSYSLTFRVYDVPSGGSALYMETHTSVSVVAGGFSVIIGSATPLDLPFDEAYWLGIQVGAAPELTPRVPLSASPYALGLRLPFHGAGGDGTTPTFELHNSIGTSMRVSNAVVVTDQDLNEDLSSLFVNGAGILRLNAPGFASSVSGIAYLGGMFGSPSGDLLGAGLTMGSPDGDNYASIIPAGTGGASLRLYNSTGTVGLFTTPSSGSRNLTLFGTDRDIALRTSDVGDASVQLPADAISAAEILDEPGVTTSTQGILSVSLTTSVSTISSTTINCPADGYVLVMASCQFGVTHTNGTLSSGFCGVSHSATTFPSNQDLAVRLQGAMPSGTYAFPVTAHGVFPVTAGAQTFYFIGQESSGAFTAEDIQLTAMFIPTAYGTVTPTLVAGGGGEMEASGGVRGALTTSEIAADREASMQANLRRIENELATIRAEMQRSKDTDERTLVTRAPLRKENP